jgi:hypothetical protein
MFDDHILLHIELSVYAYDIFEDTVDHCTV